MFWNDTQFKYKTIEEKESPHISTYVVFILFTNVVKKKKKTKIYV